MRIFLSVLLLTLLLASSCSRKADSDETNEHRKQINLLLKNCHHDIDSILHLSIEFSKESDYLGVLLSYSAMGRASRENAEFTEALKYHKMALVVAEAIADTVEMIQCNNDIATNYRRLGILDEASAYHFAALTLCDCYSDRRSPSSIKNKVKTLNGIGNIYLTLGNLQVADSVFRVALRGEQMLDSDLGQAINYANIGSIFEKRDMLDSAKVYYESSLAYNEAAHSDLGRALCYIHLGHLSEKNNEMQDAIANYKEALGIMNNSTDHWHWLEACLALANAYYVLNDFEHTRVLLHSALDIARHTKSWDYLAVVHKLYYQMYEKNGDYKRALNEFRLSCAYSDSINNNESVSNLINTCVKYEQAKSSQQISEISKSLTEETNTKTLILVLSCVMALFFATAIYSMWNALKIRKKSERALIKMEQARNSFFTNITHEFRTPLTIILGLTDKLKSQSDTKQTTDTLNTISRQGHNLLELINQLLDISKISSEIEEPDWHVGNIAAQIRMIVDNYKVYARQKVLTLLFESEQTNIEADFVPSYIIKIVTNLISNALKYTPKGGTITVRVSADNDTVTLRVSDTGVGMNEADIKHIFELFYQASNSEGKGGSGIGLPLVKQLVEKVNGTITVESKEGQGTTFVTVLKRHQNRTGLKRWESKDVTDKEDENVDNQTDTEKQIAEGDLTDIQTDDKSMPLVLVVDDNTEIASYISDVLKTQYNTSIAENGAEGIEKAKELMPDLIITDLMMPEVDGLELCRTIRGTGSLSHIPIIVVTAKCTDEERIKCYEAGADAFIVKPFNTEELQVRVASLIAQRKSLRSKFSSPLFTDKEPIDLDTASATALDAEFVNKITDIIYAQLPNHDFGADQLAQRMCMSVSQLNRKTKALTGFSTANYAMQIRIEKSKRELALTDKPIADIADICGLADSSHLTRVFTQYTQMTPSQYRKAPKEVE